MPRKKFVEKYLLCRDDTLDILKVFLIIGVDKGIRFSEFQHIIENKLIPPELFINRKIINKDRLDTRLDHMVREGILIHDKTGAPYFLNKAWYNLPIKMLLADIVEETPLNHFYFPMENIGTDDKPSFLNIEAIFGIENKNLLKDIRTELDDLIIETRVITNKLFDIKIKMIRKNCEKTLNEFYSSLTIKEKKIWISYRNKNPSFYKNLINRTIFLIKDWNGDLPSEELISKFHNDKPEDIRSLIVKAVSLIKDKLVQFYPFSTGFFSFFDITGKDIEHFSNEQLRQFLFADARSRFCSLNLKEFYDARVKENKEILKHIRDYKQKEGDEDIQDLINNLECSIKKYEGLIKPLAESNEKKSRRKGRK